MTRRSCAIYAVGVTCATLLIVGIGLFVGQVFVTLMHNRLKKVKNKQTNKKRTLTSSELYKASVCGEWITSFMLWMNGCVQVESESDRKCCYNDWIVLYVHSITNPPLFAKLCGQLEWEFITLLSCNHSLCLVQTVEPEWHHTCNFVVFKFKIC